MRPQDEQQIADCSPFAPENSQSPDRVSGVSVTTADAFEAIPVPIALLRAIDGRVLYANRSLGQLFDVSPRKLRKADLSYFIPDIADRRRLKGLATGGNGPCNLDVCSRRRDGTPLWLTIWQHRTVFEGVECSLLVMVDITDRKQAEQKQREKRGTLQQLLELGNRDREMIAFEIHDGVIQDMTGALMHAESACRALHSDKPNAEEQVRTVMRLLRDGIKEARRLIDGVRPPDLELGGLVGAVQILAEKITETTGVDVQLMHDVSGPALPPHLEMAAYRIVQEGLNNVWRHSHSDGAQVELLLRDATLSITIRDWGIGFDPESVGSKHVGLESVRQRAKLYGGTVAIESVLEQGTTLRVSLPASGHFSQDSDE